MTIVSSLTEKYVSLTKSKESLNPGTIHTVFNQLSPAEPSQLLGSWNGGFFDTGHHVGEFLKEIKWIGKDFFSIEDVDPVIVEKDGQRSSWGKWGRATVCLKFGVLNPNHQGSHTYDSDTVARSEISRSSLSRNDL